jgi:hypothetical protein
VALALSVITAGLASPARAADNDRQDAVGKANDFIADCFANGGEPDAETEDNYGWVSVSCLYDDHQDYCFYYYDPPSTSCGTIYGFTQPPTDPLGSIRPPDGPRTAEVGGDEPSPPVSDEPAAPDDQASVTAPGDDQHGATPGSTAKDKHGKHGKHGKHHKHGSKHHKHGSKHHKR